MSEPESNDLVEVARVFGPFEADLINPFDSGRGILRVNTEHHPPRFFKNGVGGVERIKNFLESHGIASIVRGRTAPFVYPFTVDGLAEFKVLVQKDDREKAEELLAAMPAPDDEEGPEKLA